MTIDITGVAMTSTVSPEYAVRDRNRGAPVWRLSWLPGQRLTGEQARAGMELDEILSDPDIVYDEHAHARADEYAALLGIGVERAVILLAQRLADRLHDAPRTDTEPLPARSTAVLPDPVPAVWHDGPLTPVGSGARSQYLWG